MSSEPFEGFTMGDPVRFQDWATRQIEKLALGFKECEHRLNMQERFFKPPFPPDIDSLNTRVSQLEESWHVLNAAHNDVKADYHNIIRKANTAEWERDEARGKCDRFRERIRELERALRDISNYARQHRENDPRYILAMLVERIPQMVQDVLQDPGTE